MTDQARRFPVALIAALAVQTVGGLVWAGGAAARIATLEQRVDEQRLVAERLARLEAQGEAVRAAVGRIERQLEGKRWRRAAGWGRRWPSRATPPCGAWPI